MKISLLIIIIFSWSLSYSQNKTVNQDSLKWEKENPNWEKTIFKDPEFINKLEISKSSKTIDLYMSMQKECRIFGYQKPNKSSKKMILLSIWTFDVKDNPCNCPFGSFYQTGNTKGISLKYIKTTNSFVEASVFKNEKQIGIVYFEKKWVEFVE